MATDLSELAGRTALVTGASSGIGVEFARQLAAAGVHLIITARREERLVALRSELMGAYPDVTVDVVTMDLTAPNAARQLHDEIVSWGRQVDILISNAGRGLFGWFLDRDWADQEAMVRLNTTVPSELAYLIAPGMMERGYGKVLFVASLAGYQATPTYAAYSAAKSYMILLGEALNFEWRGSGVSATIFSPGMTRTEFHDQAGQEITFSQRMMMMEAPVVADAGLKAMMRGKAASIPGFSNKAMLFVQRFFPRAWLKWVAYATMRNEQVTGKDA